MRTRVEGGQLMMLQIAMLVLGIQVLRRERSWVWGGQLEGSG